MRRLSAVLLLTGAAAGCRAGPLLPGAPFAGAGLLAPPSEAEAAHDDLLRADLGRGDSVARMGYAPAVAASFTSDVVYLRGGLPLVRGRDAAAAIAAAEPLGPRTTVRWQPIRAEPSADGRSGYSYGYTIYSAAPAPGGESSAPPRVRVDRYIAFWRREGSAWRISAYAETYGEPPPPLPLPEGARAGVLRDEPMRPARGALESVRAADASFSAEARAHGTGPAFARYAAGDAQVFSAPGELISGPEAIMQSFGPASRDNALVWHPVDGEVSAAGDLGFTVGNAVFTGRRADGASQVGYSKYLTVWKRQRDGGWRYVVDGGSARPIE